MFISVFDMFKIGVGPSSSHTVGPMIAAKRFVNDLETQQILEKTQKVVVHLYGSLAMTGHGHATDKAILLGLAGEIPSEVDTNMAEEIVALIRKNNEIILNTRQKISFIEKEHLIFEFGLFHEKHANAILFNAYDAHNNLLHAKYYFSVGGGFVCDEEELDQNSSHIQNVSVPYPFDNAASLLELGEKHGLSISNIMLENERAFLSDNEINERCSAIWNVMNQSIERGMQTEGILPGGLFVKRRAKSLHDNLLEEIGDLLEEEKNKKINFKNAPLKTLDWVNLFALAVNEENAAGGRIVTAPTNGAAGVIPAVLAYYIRFVKKDDSCDHDIRTFFLTAAAIGSLYKKNASISAAEVGCQGEVGVACSMAAAALTALLGGNNKQIENAAEIGMEHNLGLTCDPIKGLVQIPCIERNTMGAVKAINAARLAMHGDGSHFVPLDKVIDTMFETGKDMMTKYKETSDGGLAKISVAVPEC